MKKETVKGVIVAGAMIVIAIGYFKLGVKIGSSRSRKQ